MKKHLIINKSELHKVVFDKLVETTLDSHVLSYNGEKVIIKWIGNDPLFVDTLIFKEGPYNTEQINILLSTEEWHGPQ